MNSTTITGEFKGLTGSQANEKLRVEGINSLPSSKPKNFLSIAFGVIKEPMFILLAGCGTLYVVMGDLQEGLMLLGFVFVIMGIEFYQEKKICFSVSKGREKATKTQGLKGALRIENNNALLAAIAIAHLISPKGVSALGFPLPLR